MPKILVTGGAGFIGSHVALALLDAGYDVRVLDSLDPQVHGPDRRDPPAYLDARAEFHHGSVTDPAAVRRALDGVEGLFHLAAQVGVGQSMYEIVRYTEGNALGAAVVLQAVADRPAGLRRLVVAGSMSCYGEGAYHCDAHGAVLVEPRARARLAAGRWEPQCPHCGRDVAPRPTPESHPLRPPSIYAIGKRDHEEMFLAVGRAYRVPVTVLRFFNAYGPRQALSNPYTGVAAIFCGRLLAGRAPVIFEDGGQQRDFIHVRDVARACVTAYQQPDETAAVYNVGAGRGLTVRAIAEQLCARLDHEGRLPPAITGRFREGDIRHCVGDATRLCERLGFAARIPFAEGLEELIAWVRTQTPAPDLDRAHEELRRRGLTS